MKQGKKKRYRKKTEETERKLKKIFSWLLNKERKLIKEKWRMIHWMIKKEFYSI